MRLLLTGGNGFIAKNLISHLAQDNKYEIDLFLRTDSLNDLELKAKKADMVFHLAGVNRPDDVEEYDKGNTDLTDQLCKYLKKNNRAIPVIFTSSIQATQNNPYGESKIKAEKILRQYSKDTKSRVYIFRLTNVMGKWCKPNYNSVVATFCHNITHDIPVDIHEPDKEIDLVYIDDLVEEFIKIIKGEVSLAEFYEVKPVYTITLKELAESLYKLKDVRNTLTVEQVGNNFMRALYATYMSYLEESQFSYSIPEYNDERGRFAEIIKTKSSGQFSFFTSLPGITRGNHYHHTKCEKFLVIKGEAEFTFIHILSGKKHKINTNGNTPVIVETIPGWVHDITNIGDTELIVLLWASEIFNRSRPDTYGVDHIEKT